MTFKSVLRRPRETVQGLVWPIHSSVPHPEQVLNRTLASGRSHGLEITSTYGQAKNQVSCGNANVLDLLHTVLALDFEFGGNLWVLRSTNHALRVMLNYGLVLAWKRSARLLLCYEHRE